MIFTCKTTNLNKAIQTVQRAISSKPSTPIFSGIHLIADNNILEIQAMDLNMAIACSIEAEIQEKGEIVVSAKHFSELMRKLPGENVTIVKNKEEKTINVQSDKSDFQLLLMNEDDYPKFPEFNADKQIVLEDEKIKELIKKTIFACSTDEARPLFTGILVELQDGKITFVGTNTHRLSIKTMEQESSEAMSMIIPSRVLSEIARNLTSELPQEVKLSLLNNQIMVQRQVVEIRAQQCNYFQQTFQSNVPNWSRYRNNNEFITWANKSTIQANNGQNITVASAIDQIINTCSIRDVPALRSWLDAFDSNDVSSYKTGQSTFLR